MAAHYGHPTTSRIGGPNPNFYPRNSHYSSNGVAPSTYSWVTNPQQNSTGRSPLPPPRPHPGIASGRPLPNPHPLQRQLQLVDHDEKPLGPDIKKNPLNEGGGSDISRPPPTVQKKKTLVGGFVKGIRRLPKVVFGHGQANKGSTRQEILQNDITSTNTLPLYTSNPTTPVTGFGHAYYPRQPMVLSESSVQESRSPPPEVLRVDDTKPIIRVSQYEDDASVVDDEPRQSPHTLNDGSRGTPADRTTVMLYASSHHQEMESQGPRSHAAAPITRQSSSPGLSYASSDPPAALRPASMHSTHTIVPPIVIPQPRRIPVPGSGPRVSYASQATMPARVSTPHSIIPGAFPGSSPPLQNLPLPQPDPNNIAPAGTTPPPPPPDTVQSPVSIHPEHTVDYRKMTSSPPTSHMTLTTTTTSYEPSFSSELNPVEKFFKTLYNMPWISSARVTVDYMPGEGMGKMRKKKAKPATSWYRTMASRRSSTSLDLLSNGTATSRRTSLSASIALAFGSPLAGSRKPLSEVTTRSLQHKSSRHGHSSSRHRHRQHHRRHSRSGHRRRRRDTTTTTDTEYKAAGAMNMKPVSSPMIPPPYPFQFSYPYASFSGFPIAVPAAASSVQDQQGASTANQYSLDGRTNSPHGKKAELQPVIYAPAGYPYHQMVAQPQMYVLHPATAASMSPGQMTSITSAKAPGTNNGPAIENMVGGQSQNAQQHQLPSRVQNIPGSFV